MHRQLLSVLHANDEAAVGGPPQAVHSALNEIFNRKGLVLHRKDYDKQLILQTAFSNQGLGAVLGQFDDDGNKYMCACISRSLNKYEASYRSYKREIRVVIWVTMMFRHHLISLSCWLQTTSHCCSL